MRFFFLFLCHMSWHPPFNMGTDTYFYYVHNNKKINTVVLHYIQEKHPKKHTMHFLRIWVRNFRNAVDFELSNEEMLDIADDCTKEFRINDVITWLNHATETNCGINHNNESPIYYEPILPGNHVQLSDGQCYTWNELHHMATSKNKKLPTTNGPMSPIELMFMKLLRHIPADQVHLLHYTSTPRRKTRSKSHSRTRSRKSIHKPHHSV